MLELDQAVVTVNQKKLRLIGTHRFCSEKKLCTEEAPWADMHYKRGSKRQLKVDRVQCKTGASGTRLLFFIKNIEKVPYVIQMDFPF